MSITENFASLKYNNKHSFLDKKRNLNVVDHKYHLTILYNSRPSVFNDEIFHDQALRVVMKLVLRVIFQLIAKVNLTKKCFFLSS